jgi:orotidine 5'-phosphate decarboxylase subfamily 2
MSRPAFNDRLAATCHAAGSLLCVGLDPRARSGADAVDQCRRLIDATAPFAAAFKPNSAFFEALGTDGLARLSEVIQHVPDDRLLILDAKRGDMGSTAEAYAAAVFEILQADAVTVNPYLGHDAVAPFLADPERGAFVLCHTSNPGALDFQTLEVAGEALYLVVARAAGRWNTQRNVGLVVGATYPAAVAAVRAVAPELPFLLPGVGTQGGDLAASVAAGLDAQGAGLVVNVSRALMEAPDPAAAARRLRDDINAVRHTRSVL